MPILVCDTQPIAIEGVRAVLSGCGDLVFAESASTLQEALELVLELNPAAILVNTSLGMPEITDWMRCLNLAGSPAATVVWGAGIDDLEAMRWIRAGARGVLRRQATPPEMRACLRAVTAGRLWIEGNTAAAAC